MNALFSNAYASGTRSLDHKSEPAASPAQQPALSSIEIREEDFLTHKVNVVVVPVRLLPQPQEHLPARTGCLASCLPSPRIAAVWGPLLLGAGVTAYGGAEDMPELALGAGLFTTAWFVLSAAAGVYSAVRGGSTA